MPSLSRSRLLSRVVVPGTCALSLLAGRSVAHAEGFGPAQLWHGSFAPGAEVPMTGDFNGDGRSDIVSFVRSAPTGATGTVSVALSSGTGFGTSQRWSSWFSVGQEVPLVGDFNGDNRDDVVTFIRSSQTGTAQGDVYVALSTGSSFGAGQKWHDWFALGQETPAVGDVNGDNRDDIITFVGNTAGGTAQGDVWVALSTGSGFGAPVKMHDWFNPGAGVPLVGDVSGDGRADLLSFVRDSEPGAARGDVRVALSTGTGFGTVAVWHGFFGIGAEVPRVGDFDGDGRDDIAVFVRDTQGAPAQGDVYVAFSEANHFGASRLWHARLALGQELPVIGDPSGDRRDDVVVFLQDTQPEPRRADVLVSVTGDPSLADAQARQNDFGYGSMKVYGAPARGARALLTIMLNFSDVRFAAGRDATYFRDRLFGNALRNVNAVFQEMSGGRFAWSDVGIRGPYNHPDVSGSLVDESTFRCSLGLPQDRAYWPLACAGGMSDEHTVRRRAIELAYQDGFNFATYDFNRDGRVTANELQVLVVNAGGHVAARTADVECFSPGTGATVTVCPGLVAGVGQGTDFSSTAHELAHSLGTIDVYGSDCNNRLLSLQSCTGDELGMHLDPWHKIQLGWIEPRIYDLVQAGSCAIMDAAAAGGVNPRDDRRPILLHDSRRAGGDYFLLEHRIAAGMDEGVSTPGMALWQVRNGGRATGWGIERTEMAGIPSQVIWAGPDRMLQTVLAPGSDDVRATGGDGRPMISAGFDRFMQSVVAGDDIHPDEVHNFVYNAPDGRRGWGTLWTDIHGEITARYANRDWTELHLKVSSPGALPGSQAVKWTLHSFRGARPASSYADAYLRTCYSRVP